MPAIIENYWTKKAPADKRHERYAPGSKEALAAKKAAANKRKSVNGDEHQPTSSSSKPRSKAQSKKRSNEDSNDNSGEKPNSIGKNNRATTPSKDERPSKVSKRADSPQLVAVKKSRFPSEDIDDTSDSDDDAVNVDGYLTGRETSDLDKTYKDEKSWEACHHDLVERIDTIEKSKEGQLKFLVVWCVPFCKYAGAEML
ncbi:hypothetical protein OIV83_004344 [Microbotryomycetes sp. JL201]|nr:hypothetical protein OIV83_004344 [Microbotryomycetes sp. JL201]